MKRVMKILAGVLIVLVLVYVVRSVLNESTVTEMIKTGTLEDSVTAPGILIKDETLYSPDSDGAFEPQAREGVKVSTGEKLGSVYKGEVNPSLKKELNQINKKIETLKSGSVQNQVFSNDLGKLDSDISAKITELVKNADSRKMTKVAELKTGIGYLASHKAEVRGEAVPESESLDDLNAQKKQLESQLGAVRSDIYSKGSGIFSSYLDGLEGEITPARITQLKPSDLKKYQNIKTKAYSEAKQGVPICKVVDNFEYYVAVAIDTKLASNISNGEEMLLRFPELSTDPIECSVSFLSQDENGQVAVVLSTTKNIPDIFSKRKVTVDVIKNQYKGLKIPVSAIRVENDVKGVYVIRESVMKFIPVDISYNNNEYAIIKENAEDKNALKLYDELVLRASKYKDGMLMR